MGTYGDIWGLFLDSDFFQLFHVGLIFPNPFNFFSWVGFCTPILTPPPLPHPQPHPRNTPHQVIELD